MIIICWQNFSTGWFYKVKFDFSSVILDSNCNVNLICVLTNSQNEANPLAGEVKQKERKHMTKISLNTVHVYAFIGSPF